MLGQRSEIARRTLQRLFLLPAQKKNYKYAQRTQICQPTKKRSLLAKTKLPTVVLLSYIKTFNVVILISIKGPFDSCWKL